MSTLVIVLLLSFDKEPAAKKPPKPCSFSAGTARIATIAPGNPGVCIAPAQVRSELVDERCYAPSIEFTIELPVDRGMGTIHRETQESDAEPWADKDTPPSVRNYQFIPAQKATPRQWSWRPGGNIRQAGWIGIPSGDWILSYRLKQGAWSLRVTQTLRCPGAEQGWN